MIKKIPLYKNKKFLVSLIGVFIIFLMIVSSLNVFNTEDKTNKLKYKNYVFNKQNDQWVVFINNNYLSFKYNPLEIENITLPHYNFLLPKLYVAYNPDNLEEERFVIQRALTIFQYSNIKPVLSCYNEENCPDIPIIDCKKDASLYIKYSNDTKVYIEDNCFVLEGAQEEQLKYLDRIFYNLLSII